MDRPLTRMDADARTPRIALPDPFLPPSRRAILDLGLASMDAGPILVTGDAGIGKSWTVAQWSKLSTATRWIEVDLTPADGPSELYRSLARALGIESASATRLDIGDALADRSLDGGRYSLVIDEAQNLSSEVWEEVRVLANRFGQADGFSHLVLVGQTVLVRRLMTRALAAIESRLAAHLHLRPIDVSEAHQWLASKHPETHWSGDEVEAIHRDSGGNPGRFLRRLAAISARRSPKSAIVAEADSSSRAMVPIESDLDESEPSAMIAERSMDLPPQVGASRPPLHVEDNSIEVGWSADEPDSSESEDSDEADEPARDGLAPRLEESDQAVHDHYAALQAWREWADNQERQANPKARTDRALADEIDQAAEAEAADASEVLASDRGSVRAEGYQHFAPFGQLFTRMSPVREPQPPKS